MELQHRPDNIIIRPHEHYNWQPLTDLALVIHVQNFTYGGMDYWFWTRTSYMPLAQQYKYPWMQCVLVILNTLPWLRSGRCAVYNRDRLKTLSWRARSYSFKTPNSWYCASNHRAIQLLGLNPGWFRTVQFKCSITVRGNSTVAVISPRLSILFTTPFVRLEGCFFY